MIYHIGFDGEEVVNSLKTQRQIDEVKKLECMLVHKGTSLDWETFDNPEQSQTLFQAILRDRKCRVDEGNLMADRPQFAVITAYEGKAVRLEYYEGHDELELVYDIRAAELKGKNLPQFLESDPHAYDPAAFL